MDGGVWEGINLFNVLLENIPERINGVSMIFLRIIKSSKIILVFLVLSLLEMFSSNSYANCERVLEKSIGWTILESKIIASWQDSGEEKKDGFEGCNFGRIIFFLDGTRAKCNSFGFQFAFMPTAIILAKSVNYKGKPFTGLPQS